MPINTDLAMIADLVIDVVLSSSIEMDSEVTMDPVENGADITDNVRPLPRTINMSCLVSDTPIGQLALIRGPASSSDVKPSDYALQRLEAIRSAREPIAIRVDGRTWKSVAMKALRIDRSALTTGSLRFDASFQEVILVENTRNARVSAPRSKGGVARNQPATPVAPTPGDQYLVWDRSRWYDKRIAGWRQGALYNAHAAIIPASAGSGLFGAFTPERAVGRWELYPGKPLNIPYEVWRLSSRNSFTDDESRRLNLARPPGTRDPNAPSAIRDVLVLTANEVQIMPYQPNLAGITVP